MLVLNTSPNEDIVTNANYIKNTGRKVNISNGGSYRGSWIDVTNKYYYIVMSKSAAPWISIIRYDYSNGDLNNPVDMVLSGFTQTAQVNMLVQQGSTNGNFYIYSRTSSGAFVINSYHTVTISGTTATLGAANTVPTLTNYSINKVTPGVGGNLYVFYAQTTPTSDLVDACRKWNGSSWITLTGTALPTYADPSIKCSQDLVASRSTHFPTGLNNEYYFGNFYSTVPGKVLKFHIPTETWSETGLVGYISADVNGTIFSESLVTFPDGTTAPFSIGAQVYGLTSVINYAIYPNYASTGYIIFAGAYKALASRIRRMQGGTAANAGATWLFSVDNGVTWSCLPYISPMISDYNHNIQGDIIIMATYYSVADVIYAEIVKP